MSDRTSLHSWLNWLFVGVGALMVLMGAANLLARVAGSTLGPNAAALVFAPAVVEDSSSLASLMASSSPGTAAAPITPVTLRIPSLGVTANVEQVGMNAKGAMGAPQKFGDVAWYALGAKPGGPGNAVFAGHVDNALTEAGVFEHLSEISLGDQLLVTGAEGQTLTYAVSQIEVEPASSTPSAAIFSTSGPSQLVLITCDGDWVASEHQFNERLEVFAVLQ